MLAVLYIIASFVLGAVLILILKPAWESRLQYLLKGEKSVRPEFLFFPASYLIGTLLLSWITYFLAVAFRHSENPLLYANLLSFLLTGLLVLSLTLLNKARVKKWFYEIRKYGGSIRFSPAELVVLIGSVLFWSVFMFRSLYMDGDVLHAGVSAFSDFGAHLPVVRSFSFGKNYPAQYPHFPDGTMRYHFMFYFMAGNLEHLGLSLPWALNLPSILSVVSFSMLLYGLCVSITKKPLAGLISCGLFAFRSSFAFFTYAKDFSGLSDFFYALTHNLDADGKSREHIGSTMNESWGLWAQKVYVNQRHLAFAFGLFILALFMLLPVFLQTIEKIRSNAKNSKTGAFPGIFKYLKTILFTGEAWMPQSIVPGVIAGLILGLTAFWNGAVVIAAMSVLFIMAALSRRKLEYLAAAIVTFILSALQSRLFVGSGTGAVSLKYEPGFLAVSDKLGDILSYYVELLGILPFVLLTVFLIFIPDKSKWIRYVFAVLIVVPLEIFMPSVGMPAVILILGLCLAFSLYLAGSKTIQLQPASPWLIPAFLGPILLASTLQLTPDITVNHKYIILAVILLNVPVSDLLSGLLTHKTSASRIFAIALIFIMTCTGFVDLITLYNLDKNSVSYNQKEPVQLWVQNETEPDDIFLTHYMTHYGAPMSVMLAGRSVYSGYPYFTVTAGYDVNHRSEMMTKIYSSGNADELRALAVSEGIDYIVIEEQNRTAGEYTLNEDVFYSAFPVAFKDTERNIVIFRVQ